MDAYIPVIIWLVAAIICYYIAKKRRIKPSFFWQMTVVLLGPFAIPLVLWRYQRRDNDDRT
jgi:predicted Kef-type K+ transport protein